MSVTEQQRAVLAILANGIIPADNVDAGAAAVDAGGRIAAKIEARVNTSVYLSGLEAADRLSRSEYGKPIQDLTLAEVHGLIDNLRSDVPGFYKQLRLDVNALYLSDPGVWTRIGFPGPSTASGGYPDFDREQG